MAYSRTGIFDLLTHSPTALFPIALGLAGLGSAFCFGQTVLPFGFMEALGYGLMGLASVILALDVLLYLIKGIFARSEVIYDLSHATLANLITSGFMAAMVIGGALHNFHPLAGGLLWLIATLGHFMLLVNFVGHWLTDEYKPESLNPTWLLPSAGIMTAAMSWPHYGPIEWPIFILGVGGTLWVMVLPLVFRRVVFEPAFTPQLRPTLFIIAAPFGLMAGAIITLFPNVHAIVPDLLLSGGSFFILVLMFQFRFLARSGISLSWWATTFPIAVLAAGFLRLSGGVVGYNLIAGSVLLLLACLTTGFATIATVRAAWSSCIETLARTERQIAAMQGRELGPEDLNLEKLNPEALDLKE